MESWRLKKKAFKTAKKEMRKGEIVLWISREICCLLARFPTGWAFLCMMRKANFVTREESCRENLSAYDMNRLKPLKIWCLCAKYQVVFHLSVVAYSSKMCVQRFIFFWNLFILMKEGIKCAPKSMLLWAWSLMSQSYHRESFQPSQQAKQQGKPSYHSPFSYECWEGSRSGWHSSRWKQVTITHWAFSWSRRQQE